MYGTLHGRVLPIANNSTQPITMLSQRTMQWRPAAGAKLIAYVAHYDSVRCTIAHRVSTTLSLVYQPHYDSVVYI